MMVILAAAALIAIAAVVITAWFAGRSLVRRAFDHKLRRQASELEARLARSRADAYRGLDQMLFEMRDLYDVRVLEHELRRELDAAGPQRPAELASSFRMLGLTDRYLDEVRTARAWRERALAATALGLIGDPRGVRPLVETMRDPDEDGDVKLACAEALGRLKDPAVIAEMCELLADVDEWASPRLAQVLCDFGGGAVDPLLAALDRSESLNARIWSVQILGRIGDHRATWPIVERLHDRAESLRLSACNALAALGDAQAVAPLITVVLRDPIAAVRAQAARALGELGDERALPLLIASLGDADYWMRFRAFEAIEALAPADTAPIEAALADANPEVRRRAVLALDRMGKLEKPFNDLAEADEIASAEAEQRLIAVGRAGLSERLVRYLAAPEPRMRARIARVLGQVGELRHADALVGVIRDPDPAVALEAIAALGALAVATTVGPLLDRLSAPERAIRTAASDALLHFDSSALAGHLERLAALATDRSDEVRVAALAVIAMVRDTAATGLLVNALGDRYVDARLAAAAALGARAARVSPDGSDALADALAAALGDSSEPVQVAAAESLGRLGGPRAVEHLLRALPTATDSQRDAICFHLATLGFDDLAPALDVLMANPGEKARIGVTWTLGKTGDPRAVPLLAALLEEPDAAVRASAAGALGKLAAASADAVTALRRALADPSPYVRAASVNGLGRSAAVGVDDAIESVLADPDRFVRGRAALALARCAGGRATRRLTALPRDEVDAALIVIALALTGAAAAVGEATQRLREPGVAAAVDHLLAHEDDGLRQAYRDRMRPRTTQRIPMLGAGGLGADQLVAEYATALRVAVDPAERRHATIALAQIDDDAGAQRALADAVKHDPDVGVRREAITALAIVSAGSPALVRDAVLDATRDPDPEVRATALRAAAAIVTPANATSLLDGLRAGDPGVREAAEEACARVFTADLDGFHAWTATQDRDEVVVGAIRVLGRIADAASLSVLSGFLAAPVAVLRAEAVAALARLATPAALGAVMAGLQDPTETVRLAAVRALGSSRRADVLDALAAVAFDPSIELRATLATTLGTMASTRAIEVLAELTGDASARVAAQAALALLASPDDEGLPCFLGRHGALTADARTLVRREVERVLPRIVARLTGSMIVAVRQAAVKVLAAIDPLVHAELIALGTRDPDPRVRLLAIDALAQAGPAQLADHLRAVLDDPVGDVRTAARRALIRPV